MDMLLCEEVNPQDPIIDHKEFVIQCQNSEWLFRSIWWSWMLSLCLDK